MREPEERATEAKWTKLTERTKWVEMGEVKMEASSIAPMWPLVWLGRFASVEPDPTDDEGKCAQDNCDLVLVVCGERRCARSGLHSR
jgi:hypothetical protein